MSTLQLYKIGLYTLVVIVTMLVILPCALHYTWQMMNKTTRIEHIFYI